MTTRRSGPKPVNSGGAASTEAMLLAALACAREIDALTRMGVLTEECRNFPSESQMERESPGYRARRRELHLQVKLLSSEMFDRGASLLTMLESLRRVTADAMTQAGIRSAVQQVVLAEISTACVAATYGQAQRLAI